MCLVTIPAEHGLPPATPYDGGFAPEGGVCESGDLWVTLEGSPYQVCCIRVYSGMEKSRVPVPPLAATPR